MGPRALRWQTRLDLADGRDHRLDEVSGGGGRLHHVHAPPRADEGVEQDPWRLPCRRSLQREPDHDPTAEVAVRPREEWRAVPRELHPDGARLEGELRPGAAPARRQYGCQRGGPGDREDRAADSPHSAEADRELQEVVRLVPLDGDASTPSGAPAREPPGAARGITRASP